MIDSEQQGRGESGFQDRLFQPLTQPSADEQRALPSVYRTLAFSAVLRPAASAAVLHAPCQLSMQNRLHFGPRLHSIRFTTVPTCKVSDGVEHHCGPIFLNRAPDSNNGPGVLIPSRIGLKGPGGCPPGDPVSAPTTPHGSAGRHLDQPLLRSATLKISHPSDQHP